MSYFSFFSENLFSVLVTIVHFEEDGNALLAVDDYGDGAEILPSASKPNRRWLHIDQFAKW